MPKKDGTGPPKGSTGPRDGRGVGKGNYAGTKFSYKKGVGSKKGGSRGPCKK